MKPKGKSTENRYFVRSVSVHKGAIGGLARGSLCWDCVELDMLAVRSEGGRLPFILHWSSAFLSPRAGLHFPVTTKDAEPSHRRAILHQPEPHQGIARYAYGRVACSKRPSVTGIPWRHSYGRANRIDPMLSKKGASFAKAIKNACACRGEWFYH